MVAPWFAEALLKWTA